MPTYTTKGPLGRDPFALLPHLRIVTALAAVLHAQPLYAQPQVESLCHPQEGVLFSCVLEDSNIVSICTSPEEVPLQSIQFRFGTKDTIRVSYISTPNNKKRFSANVLPSNPKASVRHVWFDLRGSRYIVTQCLGARCHHEAGVVFYQADRVQYSKACDSSANNQAWFKNKIFDFASGASTAHSHTELIRLDDDWSEVDALYPYQLTD